MPRIPGVSHQAAVRALRKAGFEVVREGKHIVMSNGQRILTIPRANPINAFTMGAASLETPDLVLKSSRSCFDQETAAQLAA